MMSAVPVIRISRPHGNTAVLLWTGGENIRIFRCRRMADVSQKHRLWSYTPSSATPARNL